MVYPDQIILKAFNHNWALSAVGRSVLLPLIQTLLF